MKTMQDGNQNTQGDVIVRKVRESDSDAIIAIFNHYAQTSYAAYPEIPVNERFASDSIEATRRA